MAYQRALAETIFRYAESTNDSTVLTKLLEMAWSLKPLIEAEVSGLPAELGQELWMYIGVQRDANPEMARDYSIGIRKLLIQET